jgi:hypothetical protein
MKLSDDELPVASAPPRHSKKDKKNKKRTHEELSQGAIDNLDALGEDDIMNMNLENIHE